MMRAHHLPRSLLLMSLSLLASWTNIAIPGVQAAPTDLPSAASFFVPTLPDLHQDHDHPLHIYAGHLSSDPEAKDLPATAVSAHIYFALIKNRRVADKERILFWFNGGPGCSSFDGLMMEIGPFRVDGKGGIKTIEGGWEEYTTLVFVDQPAGTGYSYTSTDRYVHELTDASTQFIHFLRNFYRVFPEYRSTETFIAGESFAGQYLPYFADAILNSNLNVPLKGVAIGNGWIDVRRQYPAYLDYAVKHGLIEENSETWKQAKEDTDECLEELRLVTGEPINVAKCEDLVGLLARYRSKTVNGREKCMNVYDVRLYDDMPSCGMNWPPDLPDVTTYLGRKDVKSAFHASLKAESWIECTGRVQQELRNRNSPSSITLLPSVLERVPVMLYAGDQDFICNYVGIESLIDNMEWLGSKGLGTVDTKSWSVDGVPAGTWVSSRNLTYVKIFNSSHMVPFDVPHISHDMILRFMGVNFSAINEGSALIPSKVGDEEKPIFAPGGTKDNNDKVVPPAKTPEQDKAMWEAYYNAGSAVLVLLLIGLAIGAYLYIRRKRQSRTSWLPSASGEEHIPLSRSLQDEDAYPQNGGLNGDMKGKARAPDETIFEVGSDDEGEYKDHAK